MDKIEDRVEFTKEMKKDYKILIPNMAPIHFQMVKELFIKNEIGRAHV